MRFRINRDELPLVIEQAYADARPNPLALADGQYIRVFAIGYAVKYDADAIADVGITILKMQTERDLIGVVSCVLEPIAADLPHTNSPFLSPASTVQASAISSP